MFAKKFYQHVHITPLIRYEGPQTAWQEVWLKDETTQLTHSFKFRGTFLRLLEVPENATVVTASTGNHALAMAAGARLLDLHAQVFVPATIAPSKMQAITELGARVIAIGSDFDECKREAEKYASSSGASYISGFDDLTIIRGHASLFSECREQTSHDFDVVFVPVGGGGLLAGCLQYYQGTCTRVIGVELDCVPSMQAALQKGEPITLPPAQARTAGLLVRTAGLIPFQIAQRGKNLEIQLVSDAQIQQTMRLLWKWNAIRAEEAGAAALTAALSYQAAHQEQRVLAVVSGGNIGEQAFQEALAE